MKDVCQLITDLQRGKTYFIENDKINRIIEMNKIIKINKIMNMIKVIKIELE